MESKRDHIFWYDREFCNRCSGRAVCQIQKGATVSAAPGTETATVKGSKNTRSYENTWTLNFCLFLRICVTKKIPNTHPGDFSKFIY